MHLKRRLNLFDATLLVIGNVVGAGIIITISGLPFFVWFRKNRF